MQLWQWMKLHKKILWDDTCQPFVFKTNPQPSLLSYFNHRGVPLQRDNLMEEFHNQIGWTQSHQTWCEMNPHNADYRVAIFGAGGQSVKFLFLVNLPTVTPKQLEYLVLRSWENQHHFEVYEWNISRSLCGNNWGHIQVREMSDIQHNKKRFTNSFGLVY